MAKRRDFQSDIDRLNSRRENLRSNIPLPPNLIIAKSAATEPSNPPPTPPPSAVSKSVDNVSEEAISSNTPVKSLKRRTSADVNNSAPPTPESGKGRSPVSKDILADSKSKSISTANISTSGSNSLSVAAGSSRSLLEKPSPKALSPGRVHSTEFHNEVHDDLSDIIAQLNVNKLSRRNVNADDGCLQTLTAILENQHVFVQGSQVSTITPAHMEILVEVLIRAHSDGLGTLLNRTCRFIQAVVTTTTLPTPMLSAIVEPLSSLSTTNGLIILTLETELSNECMNIIESVARVKNLKIQLQRICGIGDVVNAAVCSLDVLQLLWKMQFTIEWLKSLLPFHKVSPFGSSARFVSSCCLLFSVPRPRPQETTAPRPRRRLQRTG
jgi:hypothetical protein